MISCSSADMIRGINDPEHPLTLEELNVVEESKVKVRLKFCSKISLFSHKLIKNTTQYYIVICLAFPLYAIFETVCFVWLSCFNWLRSSVVYPPSCLPLLNHVVTSYKGDIPQCMHVFAGQDKSLCVKTERKSQLAWKIGKRNIKEGKFCEQTSLSPQLQT